ncbi:MAG: 50S ribosomal protein L19 [Candidatus Margulisiibacteriota bacterium]
MNKKLIDEIEKEQLREDKTAKFNVGDTVKVLSRIVEGEKTRSQAFEGTVIKITNAGARTTFIVRKVVATIGVEKTFVLHSPNMQKITVLKSGKTRRAKLYYLRERIGSKATRIKDAE